jgi:glycosyltransferase involved in cell wall biosynthesis
VHKIFALLFLIGSLGACSIEEIQPQENHNLVIAHNFMSVKQQEIFTKIANRHHIDLSFKKLTATEIRRAIQSHPWEPGFDLVFIAGIQEQKLLHPLPFQYREPEFALTPIGVSYVSDSSLGIKTYQDLARKFLWSAADSKAESLLRLHLSYIFKDRFTEQKTELKYSQILRGLKNFKVANDAYQLQNGLVLCSYDTYLNFSKKIRNKRKFNAHLQKGERVFTDFIGLYIVEQNTRFQLARKFVKYLHQLRAKQEPFRANFGMFPKTQKIKHYPFKKLLPYLDK